MSCKCLAEHVVAHSFSNSILFLKKIYLERDLSMTTIKKNPTIKPLPRGLGTMTLTKNGTIEYKKIILYPDGSKKRKTVHGTSQKECLNKMNDFEKNDIRQVRYAILLAMHWQLTSILDLGSVNCSPLLGKTLTLLTI